MIRLLLQKQSDHGLHCLFVLFGSPGILLEISVDGPKAHQQKFPWALIGPGVWGPPRHTVGSRGNAPVGAENDSSIAGSLYLSSP